MIEHEYSVTATIEGELLLFRTLWNTTNDNMFVVAVNNNEEFVLESINDSLKQLMNLGNGDFAGQKISEMMNEEVYETVSNRYKQCIELNKPISYEESIELDNDIKRHWSTTILPVRDEKNGTTKIFGISREFTELKKIESELLTSNKKLENQSQYLQNIIDGVDDSITVISPDYSISMMNKKAKKLLLNKNIHNLKCYEVLHNRTTPCNDSEYLCPFLEKSSTCSTIRNHKLLDGSEIVTEMRTSPLTNNNGDVYAVIESAYDITELLSAQNQLNDRTKELLYITEYDELTDLPNRSLFLKRLTQSVKCSKNSHKEIAVFCIDLDHFKEINDSIGHAAGDKVICEVSKRLSSLMYSNDILARLGGDEFAIIINDIESSGVIIEKVQELMKVMNDPFEILGQKLYTSLSIGIAMYPEDAKTSSSLLKNADAAMYKAKSDGRNTYSFYDESMTIKAFERISIEASLRQALINKEFIVYYQPQVNGQSNQLIGMEALVRWDNLTLGLVSPAKFIPLAEEIGLIVELDRFVMKTAMTQMAAWYKEGKNPGVLAMNLAVKQLESTDFIDMFKNLIIETECKAEWIELEVTEGQIMNNPKESIETLNSIANLGIKLAVDDFGTGYSSLAYLKRLPIDKLKIDQAFIRGLPNDNEDSAITKAIIALAQSLNLSIIAEGVETKEQRDFLIKNGCENMQGYYSKPISAKQFNSLLKNGI